MSQTLMNQDQAIATSVKLTREGFDQFTQQINALNQKLSGVSEIFQGNAAVSWGRVMVAWNEQVDKLLTSLSDFGDKLDTSDKTFQNTDSEAEQALTKLMARLG